MFEFNKIYSFNLTGTFSFGNLNNKSLIRIFKDGRVASHFLEEQLTVWFPNLTHVVGCKDHDHYDESAAKYDAKNFTAAGGCKFMPSNMIGTGRTFDQKLFEFKANNMHYIICDIVDFPKIRVLFKRGADLLHDYPKGKISKTHRETLFNE